MSSTGDDLTPPASCRGQRERDHRVNLANDLKSDLVRVRKQVPGNGCIRVFGSQLEKPLQVFRRCFRLTSIELGDSKQIVCAGVVGVGLEDPLKRLRRLLRLTLVVELCSELEKPGGGPLWVGYGKTVEGLGSLFGVTETQGRVVRDAQRIAIVRFQGHDFLGPCQSLGQAVQLDSARCNLR